MHKCAQQQRDDSGNVAIRRNLKLFLIHRDKVSFPLNVFVWQKKVSQTWHDYPMLLLFIFGDTKTITTTTSILNFHLDPIASLSVLMEFESVVSCRRLKAQFAIGVGKINKQFVISFDAQWPHIECTTPPGREKERSSHLATHKNLILSSFCLHSLDKHQNEKKLRIFLSRFTSDFYFLNNFADV